MNLNLESFLHHYPYTPGVKGINFGGLFPETQYSRIYYTEQGQPVVITLCADKVEIVQNSPFPFAYGLQGNIEEGEVSFTLRTRDGMNTPFPDLFAREFVICALGFFETNTHVLESWFSGWNRRSTNFVQFTKNLSIGMSFEEAVWHTWSGRQAWDNRFRRLEQVSRLEAELANKDMAVRFYR